MSDNQRRACCRILFLFVCALPTSAITYWICHPQTAAGWEQAIQAQLGVTTKIDSVETPSPNVTILRMLQFFDSENRLIFETVETRIEFGEINVVKFPYRVKGLTSAGMTGLFKNMNQRLIHSETTNKRWSLEFEKPATVVNSNPDFQPIESPGQHQPPTALEFAAQDLQIDISPSVGGMLATLSFKTLDDNGQPKHVNFQISKTRQLGHSIDLETNGASLPCWLATYSIPSRIPSSLGSNATFSGSISTLTNAENSEVYFTGTIAHVNLKRSLNFPGPESRFAKIELGECVFVNGTPTKWNAFLHQERNPKLQIYVDDLIATSTQIDPGAAIANTIFRDDRAARAESPRNR